MYCDRTPELDFWVLKRFLQKQSKAVRCEGLSRRQDLTCLLGVEQMKMFCYTRNQRFKLFLNTGDRGMYCDRTTELDFWVLKRFLQKQCKAVRCDGLSRRQDLTCLLWYNSGGIT